MNTLIPALNLPIILHLAKTTPSREHVRIAADSTMLRMVNLLIALSLGVHREQLLQRMGLT
jgi:small neutral amino acid transporter SnatA (MarC family)